MEFEVKNKVDIDVELTPQEKTNIQVILQLNDYVNQEKYEQMDALFADNYVDHNPGWDIDSIEDFKDMIANGHQNFDVHNEIQRIIPDGDLVFNEVVNFGTHQQEVFGQPPTGKETQMTNYEIYRFEDGKIAERWVISNLIGLMKQVGVDLPVPL